MDRLKLVALDGEDIEVVSAHLQDAVIKTADIHWRPSQKRVVIALDRFDWGATIGASPQYRRRRAALRFDRVSACKSLNVIPSQKAQVLNLLAVVFEMSDPPGGTVILTFSGGAALRLEIECLEAELVDLGPVWVTENRPLHAADDDGVENKPKETSPRG